MQDVSDVLFRLFGNNDIKLHSFAYMQYFDHQNERIHHNYYKVEQAKVDVRLVLGVWP
jgi:hypothetical protein